MEGEPAQVRMADRHEAEEVVDLALESARRERPRREGGEPRVVGRDRDEHGGARREGGGREDVDERERDRKSTRLNSSHGYISYAVFCLKKKKRARSAGSPRSTKSTSDPR